MALSIYFLIKLIFTAQTLKNEHQKVELDFPDQNFGCDILKTPMKIVLPLIENSTQFVHSDSYYVDLVIVEIPRYLHIVEYKVFSGFDIYEIYEYLFAYRFINQQMAMLLTYFCNRYNYFYNFHTLNEKFQLTLYEIVEDELYNLYTQLDEQFASYKISLDKRLEVFYYKGFFSIIRLENQINFRLLNKCKQICKLKEFEKRIEDFENQLDEKIEELKQKLIHLINEAEEKIDELKKKIFLIRGYCNPSIHFDDCDINLLRNLIKEDHKIFDSDLKHHKEEIYKLSQRISDTYKIRDNFCKHLTQFN